MMKGSTKEHLLTNGSSDHPSGSTNGHGHAMINNTTTMSGTTSTTNSTAGAAAATAAAAAAAAQFKLLLLIGMVLQNSSTVLVGRYTRAGVPKEDQYDVNHLIVIIELGKLLLSCGLEYYTTAGQLFHSIQLHIVSAPEDAVKIVIPALLYLVQNTLLYVALTNLTAPLFQVTYQCKLVTTAFVSVLMLKVRYTLQQWICLTIISIGVAIVVLGETKDDPTKKTSTTGSSSQSLTIGLTAVTIACFSSACAGVYFEMVLKKPSGGGGNNNNNNNSTDTATSNNNNNKPAASLWMRNIQLSFISIVIALLQNMFHDNVAGNAYLHGFTGWTWVLVWLQAAGGLLVAAVIKYADNVLKGLATGVSVVLATAVSMILFNTPLTGQFLLGAVMILVSVYYFSNPLPTGWVVQLNKIKGSIIMSGSSSGSNSNGGHSNSRNNWDNESKVEIKSLLPK